MSSQLTHYVKLSNSMSYKNNWETIYEIFTNLNAYNIIQKIKLQQTNIHE